MSRSLDDSKIAHRILTKTPHEARAGRCAPKLGDKVAILHDERKRLPDTPGSSGDGDFKALSMLDQLWRKTPGTSSSFGPSFELTRVMNVFEALREAYWVAIRRDAIVAMV